MKKNNFLCIVMGLVVSSWASGFERFSSGDQAYLACETAVLYEEPTSFSTPVKILKFGASLRVKGLKNLFELPSTDFSSRKRLEDEENSNAEREERKPKPISPDLYTRAAWLQFDQGYAASSCFVTKSLFDDQTIAEVQKRVDSLASGKAKRNFSEDESGDMTAMRGAAGKAKGGKADYDTIDKLISSEQGSFELKAHEQFRQEGKLGEFK